MDDEANDSFAMRTGKAVQTGTAIAGVVMDVLNPLAGPGLPSSAAPPPDDTAIVRSVDEVGLEDSPASALYTLEEKALERDLKDLGGALERQLEERSQAMLDAISAPAAQENSLIVDDVDIESLFPGGESGEVTAQEAMAPEVGDGVDALFDAEVAAESQAMEADAGDAPEALFVDADEPAAAGFVGGEVGGMDGGGEPGLGGGF